MNLHVLFPSIRVSITLCFLFQIAFYSSLFAQEDFLEVNLGETIVGTFDEEEKHTYQLPLDTNSVAYLRLEQKGIDVEIITFDLEGNKVEVFDSPNGDFGPENFTISSNKKGVYTFEVSPYSVDNARGGYEVSLELVKPKATTKSGQVDELFTFYNLNDSPGAAVSIIKEGKVLYSKGYGMANLEYNIPNTSKTVFHVASVSKQFTVFAILLLESDGKLSLDDDIRKYLPEVPDFGETVTLRHLAAHTSGLRDQWNLLTLAGWRIDDVITQEQVLKLVSQQEELNFKPGEEFLYCNTGFTLLAEVVEKISGKSFAAFTKERIFEPLEMTRTLFYDDHQKIVKNRAYSYSYGNGELKKRKLNYSIVGPTSLFTTVDDLSKWSLNITKPKVGTLDLFEKMHTETILNDGSKAGAGLGQFLNVYKGLTEIEHGGADAGFRTFLTRFPDQDFSVVLFSNSGEFNPPKMAHKIVDIYLEDYIKAEKPIEEVVEEESSSENVVKGLQVDSEILKSYVGDFELKPNLIIKVEERNGQLFAQATGQRLLVLVAESDKQFKVKDGEAVFEFVRASDGAIDRLELIQEGQILVAKRVKAFDPASVNLSEFVGRYYSKELSTTYSLVDEEGRLVTKHLRLNDTYLEPIKEDLFQGPRWGFGKVQFIRNTDEEVIGFKVTVDRMRNVHFDKVMNP